MKFVYVLIRYSLLYHSPPKSFHLSTSLSDNIHYRSVLFDKSRLKKRQLLFDGFTLPSLDQVYQNKPHDINLKVLVMTSTQLPKENKDFLQDRSKKYPWLGIHYFPPSGINMNAALQNLIIQDSTAAKQLIIATVRLDDDDALAKSYLVCLNKYMNPNYDNHIISFPQGVALYFDSCQQSVIGYHEVNSPKIALGLCLVKCYSSDDIKSETVEHIYNAGNHINVDSRYNVIYDDHSPSYIRVNSEYSDRMYTLDEAQRSRRLRLELRKKLAKVESNTLSSSQLLEAFEVNPHYFY
jgi:hypothetical protein